MDVVVGGVAQLYQGDLDVGRLAVERLAREELGHGVLVEELSYGAVAVAQRLEDLRPDALVLVGAAERGRRPGAVERRRVADLSLTAPQVRQAVMEAVTGYVSIDLVLEVAGGLGALPARTVVVEVEPASTEVAERLTPEGKAGLEHALELVRAEVRRLPLLDLADRLRALLAGDRLAGTPAAEALRELLSELATLDAEGRWGDVFARRDRLRERIAAGQAPEAMTHLDWALWWALIEELDRLEGLRPGPREMRRWPGGPPAARGSGGGPGRGFPSPSR